MICPRCSSNQSEDIKFCTSLAERTSRPCVRRFEPREPLGSSTGATRGWPRCSCRRGRRAAQAGDGAPLGITPEVKRYNEIKAGVIVSSIGIGVSIFLIFFMNGIATTEPRDAEVIKAVWLAGVVPFMVGLALIINGVVVSKRMVEVIDREREKSKSLEEGPAPRGLRSPDTSEFIPANFSVTDQTTRHLENAERKIRKQVR